MEIKCEYTSKEVEQMVVEVHSKNFTLPEGMEWHATEKTYGGVEVIALKKKGQIALSEIPVKIAEEVQPL